MKVGHAAASVYRGLDESETGDEVQLEGLEQMHACTAACCSCEHAKQWR